MERIRRMLLLCVLWRIQATAAHEQQVGIKPLMSAEEIMRDLPFAAFSSSSSLSREQEDAGVLPPPERHEEKSASSSFKDHQEKEIVPAPAPAPSSSEVREDPEPTEQSPSSSKEEGNDADRTPVVPLPGPSERNASVIPSEPTRNSTEAPEPEAGIVPAPVQPEPLVPPPSTPAPVQRTPREQTEPTPAPTETEAPIVPQPPAPAPREIPVDPNPVAPVQPAQPENPVAPEPLPAPIEPAPPVAPAPQPAPVQPAPQERTEPAPTLTEPQPLTPVQPAKPEKPVEPAPVAPQPPSPVQPTPRERIDPAPSPVAPQPPAPAPVQPTEPPPAPVDPVDPVDPVEPRSVNPPAPVGPTLAPPVPQPSPDDSIAPDAVTPTPTPVLTPVPSPVPTPMPSPQPQPSPQPSPQPIPTPVESPPPPVRTTPPPVETSSPVPTEVVSPPPVTQSPEPSQQSPPPSPPPPAPAPTDATSPPPHRNETNASAEVPVNRMSVDSTGNHSSEFASVVPFDTRSWTPVPAITKQYVRGEVWVEDRNDDEFTNEHAPVNRDHADASRPNVIGGRNRNRAVDIGAQLSKTSMAMHAVARHSVSGFAVISIALLLWFHLVALKSSTGGFWAPNTWECLLYLSYLQHLASLGQLTLVKAPYVLWDFVDGLSWTQFLIPETSASVHPRRRLETVVLGGIVSYADRIGTHESKILYHVAIGFVLVLGLVLVAFVIMALIAKQKPQWRCVSLRLLGLSVVLWFMALYPLSMTASFELLMETRAKKIADALTIALMALLVVCFGGVVFTGRVLYQKSALALHEPECQMVYGALYADSLYERRMFYVVTAMLQITSGIVVGAVDADPTQVIVVLLLHLLYGVVVGIVSPFAKHHVQRVVIGITMLKALNYAMAFAFLNSDRSPSSLQTTTSVVIAINSIVIFVWFLRQLVVFSTFVRLCMQPPVDDECPPKLDTSSANPVNLFQRHN